MRTRLMRGKISLLFLTIAVLLAVPAIALADTISADPDPATVVVVENNVNKAPGETGTAKVWLAVDDNSTDPVNGCNAATDKPVSITLSSNNPDVTFDSSGTKANPASLTGCTTTNAKEIGYTVSSSATGPFPKTVQVTASGSGGRITTTGGPSGTTNIPAYTSDTFTVTITAPPNTAPTTPGTPGLASGSSTPNQGAFTLNWTASTDDGNPTGSSVTYTLQHKDANDAGFTDVAGATNLSNNSYTFPAASKEAEGTWTYQVKASDGTLSSAFSSASNAIKVDRTPPSAPTTATTDPSSAAFSGWFKDSVKVTYSGSTDGALPDGSAGSGVASYSGPETFSTSGSHSYSGTATDGAGNVSAAKTGTVKVDTDAPVSSFDSATNASGNYTEGDWTNEAVTVKLSASDNNESGVQKIVYSTDGGNTYQDYQAGGISVTQEGTTTIQFHAVDNVGHVESADHSFTVKLDKTAPNPNCGSASADWLGTDASIACNPTDSGGSGLAGSVPATFNLVTNVPAGTEDANASTNSREISDAAGNTATAGPIAGNKVDKKAPSFLCDDADDLWHASNVSLGCTASDGGSGLDDSANDASFSLSTSVTAGTETANASTGSRSVKDAVGNTATAGPIEGNKIDMKVPGITLTTPANNAVYTLGQAVNAAYSCNDFGSGLASCLGTVNNGSPINTSTIGMHSFKVDAKDNVGNPNSVSSSYGVAAAFNGFLQPIDGNLVNTGKWGRVYPVKWQLRDASGVLLSDEVAQALVSSMTVTQRTAVCDTGAPADALETEAGAAGSTSVRYDAASDQFIFNYKAPSSGSCYTLNVNKADGVNTKSILFKFTK